VSRSRSTFTTFCTPCWYSHSGMGAAGAAEPAAHCGDCGRTEILLPVPGTAVAVWTQRRAASRPADVSGEQQLLGLRRTATTITDDVSTHPCDDFLPRRLSGKGPIGVAGSEFSATAVTTEDERRFVAPPMNQERGTLGPAVRPGRRVLAS